MFELYYAINYIVYIVRDVDKKKKEQGVNVIAKFELIIPIFLDPIDSRHSILRKYRNQRLIFR